MAEAPCKLVPYYSAAWRGVGLRLNLFDVTHNVGWGLVFRANRHCTSNEVQTVFC